jgi:hypothetical protein
VVSVSSQLGVAGAIVPDTPINIPVGLAHLEMPENDELFRLVVNSLKKDD